MVKSLFVKDQGLISQPFWDNLLLFFLLINLRWAQWYVSLVTFLFPFIPFDDCKQIDEKYILRKGKHSNIMKKRCAIVCFCHSFQYFLFPLSFSYYTLISCPVGAIMQCLTQKLYFNNSEYNCIVSKGIESMSSLRIMLLAKAYPSHPIHIFCFPDLEINLNLS